MVYRAEGWNMDGDALADYSLVGVRQIEVGFNRGGFATCDDFLPTMGTIERTTLVSYFRTDITSLKIV